MTSRLSLLEALYEAARELRFDAYPAHGSGFVLIVSGGNTDDLIAALAALDAFGRDNPPDGKEVSEHGPEQVSVHNALAHWSRSVPAGQCAGGRKCVNGS